MSGRYGAVSREGGIVACGESLARIPGKSALTETVLSTEKKLVSSVVKQCRTLLW